MLDFRSLLEPPEISGAGSVSQAAPAVGAVGLEREIGTGAPSQAAASVAATGREAFEATAAVSQAAGAVSGVGREAFKATTSTSQAAAAVSATDARTSGQRQRSAKPPEPCRRRVARRSREPARYPKLRAQISAAARLAFEATAAATQVCCFDERGRAGGVRRHGCGQPERRDCRSDRLMRRSTQQQRRVSRPRRWPEPVARTSGRLEQHRKLRHPRPRRAARRSRRPWRSARRQRASTAARSSGSAARRARASPRDPRRDRAARLRGDRIDRPDRRITHGLRAAALHRHGEREPSRSLARGRRQHRAPGDGFGQPARGNGRCGRARAVPGDRSGQPGGSLDLRGRQRAERGRRRQRGGHPGRGECRGERRPGGPRPVVHPAPRLHRPPPRRDLGSWRGSPAVGYGTRSRRGHPTPGHRADHGRGCRRAAGRRRRHARRTARARRWTSATAAATVAAEGRQLWVEDADNDESVVILDLLLAA
jgi:hypothetical protein